MVPDPGSVAKNHDWTQDGFGFCGHNAIISDGHIQEGAYLCAFVERVFERLFRSCPDELVSLCAFVSASPAYAFVAYVSFCRATREPLESHDVPTGRIFEQDIVDVRRHRLMPQARKNLPHLRGVVARAEVRVHGSIVPSTFL